MLQKVVFMKLSFGPTQIKQDRSASGYAMKFYLPYVKMVVSSLVEKMKAMKT